MTDTFYNERLELPSDGADDATLREYGRQLAMDSLIRDALHSTITAHGTQASVTPIQKNTDRKSPAAWWAAAAACMAGAIGLSIWHFGQSEDDVDYGGDGAGSSKVVDSGTPGAKSVITIPLPRARYIGTPKPIMDPTLPHLEKLQEEERFTKLELTVPAGTRLLSKGKPVTASEEPIDGDLEMITDGDMDAEQYCDIGINGQSVTIDLGAEHSISAVVVWHFHEGPRAFHDVVVEIANDAAFAGESTILFNSDHDESLGKGHGAGTDPAYVETNEGRVIMAHGERGRYVRLWTRGSSSDENNYYTEVKVFGK